RLSSVRRHLRLIIVIRLAVAIPRDALVTHRDEPLITDTGRKTLDPVRGSRTAMHATGVRAGPAVTTAPALLSVGLVVWAALAMSRVLALRARRVRRLWHAALIIGRRQRDLARWTLASQVRT